MTFWLNFLGPMEEKWGNKGVKGVHFGELVCYWDECNFLLLLLLSINTRSYGLLVLCKPSSACLKRKCLIINYVEHGWDILSPGKIYNHIYWFTGLRVTLSLPNRADFAYR